MVETFKWKDNVCFSQDRLSEEKIRIYLSLGSEKVGYADILELKNYFGISDFKIFAGFRDAGNASVLIEGINKFLESKKRNGYLINGIIGDKRGLYKSHGWVEDKENTGGMWYIVNK